MRATFFTLFFSFIFCLNGHSQNCLPNGITFSTQAEIDNFPINYPGCTVIEGDVRILGSNIANLNGLSGVTAVGGSLSIYNNSGLTNLNGLENITSVGWNLEISNNSGLTSLGVLTSITSVGGGLWVANNSNLTSLNGLENITNVTGLFISNNAALTSLNGLGVVTVDSGMNISHNPLLTDLTGLESLVEVHGAFGISNNNALLNLNGLQGVVSISDGLYIDDNPSLASLSGLNNLASTGHLVISYNPLLTNLSDLGNLTSAESIQISDNSALTSLSGLHNIASFGGGSLLIFSNLALTSLSGLGNIASVGGEGLYISGNTALASLDGLETINSVGGNGLVISYNSSLTSLDGLENITSVGNRLSISSNQMLTNLSGLKNLVSVGGHFSITYNPVLTSLSGLEKISTIGDIVFIESNPMLTSLDGLNNLSTIGGNILYINDNQSLSDCAIFAVCNYLQGIDSVFINNNAPGCNSPAEVASQCATTPVVVEIQTGDNSDCSSGTPVPDLQVQLKGTAQMTIKPTNANGVVEFGYLESGPFALDMPEVNDQNWKTTQFTQTLTASDGGDSFHVFLCLSPITQCPELTATLGLPSNFRGCLVNSDIQISAQNTGTVLAEGVRLAAVMPPVFELLGSAPLVSFQNGDTLFFEMGDLKPFEKASATLTVKTKCDTFLFGQTLCWQTFAAMDNPCPATPIAFSEIKLSVECVGGTLVRFTMKNIGDAPTQGWHEYKIIRNGEILYSNSFSLNAQQSLSFDFPADGATWRMEATKFDDGTPTAVALENCGGLTPGYITAFWLDEGPVDYDFDCRLVIGSYDPNQKTAVPTGVGWQNVIVPNHPMQYTIDFQNTGTDTAFRVLLRDALPPQLDISTFRPIASSHPCAWELRSNNLEVLFSPIALPDSNVNEPASHGFFTFSIDQKPNLPDGTSLYNNASIIFDFNPPIWTNTVYHSIGKLTVQVDEAQPHTSLWRVWGNPVRDAATFRTEEFIAGEKRFELYDTAGRLVRSAQFSGQEFEFQRDFLPSGLYFFKISDEQGRVFSGKIVAAE